jgi:hypothetical protein
MPLIIILSFSLWIIYCVKRPLLRNRRTDCRRPRAEAPGFPKTCISTLIPAQARTGQPWMTFNLIGCSANRSPRSMVGRAGLGDGPAQPTLRR